MRTSAAKQSMRPPHARKVVIVGLAIVIAIAIPAVEFYMSQRAAIAQAELDLDWVNYVKPLISMMINIQQRRQLVAASLGGSDQALARLHQLDHNIENRMQSFSRLDQRLQNPLDSSIRWLIIKHEWKNLAAHHTGLTSSELNYRHDVLLANLWNLIVHTADTAEMGYTGSVGEVYQVDALRMQIPSLINHINLADNLLLQHKHAAPLLPLLQHQLAIIDTNLSAIQLDMTRSDAHQPAANSTINKNLQSLKLQQARLARLSAQLQAGALTAPLRSSLLQFSAASSHAAARLFHDSITQLAESFGQRLVALKHRLGIYLALALGVAAVVLGLFIAMYRSMLAAILDRFRAESNLHQVKNLHEALGHIHQLIAHRSEQAALFDKVCQVAVKEGTFCLSAIVLFNSDSHEPVVAAWAGAGDFSGIDDRELNRLILACASQLDRVALRPEPVVASNFDAPAVFSFGTRRLETTLRVAGFWPLSQGGKVVGAMTLFGQNSTLFDAQVKTLIAEMAAALSFALDDLEREQTRRIAEHALRDSEQRYHLIMEGAGDAILLMDADGRILEANRRACEQFGYSRHELLAMRSSQLFPPQAQDDAQTRQIKVLHDGQTVNTTTVALRKNFATYPVELSESRVEFQGRSLLLGIFRDISDRKAAEERIKYLAYHDPLTNLPNRTLLNDRLEQSLRHARRENTTVGVIFLDLDNFKSVNDTLGHDFGDELLQRAARRLRSALRSEDTVARLGGDEFVVILPQPASADEVAQVAEKILQTMSVPFVISGHTFHITCSMGMSLFPRDGQDCGELLRNADEALYRAKKDGRNRFAVHSPEMHAATVETLWMENDLREALHKEQFVLHYQPQVDLSTGKIIGAEALIRWRHPQRGLISPAKFIPLAEERGLMLSLGSWILHSACHQIKRWQNSGLPVVPVAVNLSGIQCREASLTNTIANVLSTTGLDPRLLELEITEGTLMSQTDSLRARMIELKKLGIRFSLDDFGTGYSSLSYLTRFPIDTLKIDISFVRGMLDDPKDLAVVDTIIDLADNLQLHTVAEGVENAEQVTLLKLLECRSMQGYYFSKPLAPDDFAAMLAQDRRLIPISQSKVAAEPPIILSA